MKARCVIAFLFCSVVQSALGVERPAGQVVWWGQDVFWKRMYSEHTNGVLELGDETLSDAVEIAAHYGDIIALKTDGTVVGFGLNFLGVSGVPRGLSNAISVVMTGNSAWAIKRDGTVVRWGESDEDQSGIVGGLTNVTAIAWAGYRSYLALKNDGTVLGFRFDDSPVVDPTTGLPIQEVDHSPIRQVKVRGQVLSNVVALASMGYTPLVLKNDGTVLSLGYQTPGTTPAEPVVTQIDEKTIAIDMGGESGRTPYHYTSADPVIIDGEILKNVAALVGEGGHALALESNGTVVAWGDNPYGQTNVPTGLSNVTAIAAGQHLSLALKRDGTVVAWGGNYHGQTSVPAGLSNVVAIAAGGMFGMAITTGSVPASVYVRPHGRLEELEREADIVFKGRVVSTKAMTNASFPHWGKPHATRFQVISTLKGILNTNELTFWHNTAGPMGWGGGTPPSHHQFQTGQCYLVFAVNLDKPAYLYSPPADAPARTNEFRQTYRDGVTRTLDARPIIGISIKEAHWLELNRLLTNAVPTNSLYAIRCLNEMSRSCVDSWMHTDTFKRQAVLKAVQPLITNSNDQVALSAIGCFDVGGSRIDLFGELNVWPGGWMPISCGCADITTECVASVAPYADALIAVANSASSSLRRAAAIAALSCTKFPAVSNSLPRWLADSASDVRAQAVLVLPDFPGEFCERGLQEKAADASPIVRGMVADAIGIGRIETLLPTLEFLFAASPVRTNSDPWPHKGIQGDGYSAEVGSNDIRTSAGYALLKFNVNQVGKFLKTHLNDSRFGPDFLCKLAETDVAPWLSQIANFLEAWVAREKEKAPDWGADPKTYAPPLSGVPFRLWNIVYDHLQSLPSTEFADGKLDRYLDVLRKAGTNGSREPVMLYELCRTKRLEERATKIRRESEGGSAAEHTRKLFDSVDARYTNRLTNPKP